jgi:acetolactate synthase-1/2/3 large subunit
MPATLSVELQTVRGAELLVECLVREGVEYVFGISGGAVIEICDALYHYRDRIKFILNRHEQGAAHMADGYARASGKVGVCLATSGPGSNEPDDRCNDSLHGFGPHHSHNGSGPNLQHRA